MVDLRFSRESLEGLSFIVGMMQARKE